MQDRTKHILLVIGLLLAMTAYPVAAQTPLDLSPVAPGAFAGKAVAASDDFAFVGANADDEGVGAVYVYERTDDGWTQVQKLSPTGTVSGFGESIAVEGGLLAVGAPFQGNASTGGSGPGTVFLYRLSGRTWQLEEALIASPDARIRDQFGSSVSISNGRLLGGAPASLFEGRPRGTAYLYERQAGQWNATAALRQDSVSSMERFGSAVALYGDRAAVGSYLHWPRTGNIGFLGAGAVYVFERLDDATWDLTATLEPAADPLPGNTRLGFSLVAGPDGFLAGGPGQGRVHPIER